MASSAHLFQLPEFNNLDHRFQDLIRKYFSNVTPEEFEQLVEEADILSLFEPADRMVGMLFLKSDYKKLIKSRPSGFSWSPTDPSLLTVNPNDGLALGSRVVSQRIYQEQLSSRFLSTAQLCNLAVKLSAEEKNRVSAIYLNSCSIFADD